MTRAGKKDLEWARELIAVVGKRTGLSFKEEKLNDLADWLARRRVESGWNGPEADIVSTDHRYNELLDFLTVNESYFFREPLMFELFDQEIFPDIFERGDSLRIFSAGCSRGEEPYSIAISAAEGGWLKRFNRVEIFATDISTESIATAKQGLYALYSMRGLKDSALRRNYFETINETGIEQYRVSPDLKKYLHFEQANLMEFRLPPGSVDIIVCRNVLLYFGDESRKQLFKHFSEMLSDGGRLVLGATEAGSKPGKEFQLKNYRDYYYYEKSSAVDEPVCGIREDVGAFARQAKAAERTHRPKPTGPKISAAPPATNPATIKNEPPAVGRRADRMPDAAQTFLLMVEGCYTGKAAGFAREKLESGGHELPWAEALLLLRLSDESLVIEDPKIEPGSSSIERFDKGMSERSDGRYAEAIESFNAAIFLDVNFWPAHFFLAETWRLAGDEQQAERKYRNALKIMERNPTKNKKGETEKPWWEYLFNKKQIMKACRKRLGA